MDGSFLELASARYSCRKISPAPVEQEKVDKILEAARLSPTACNYQPYRIWVLRSEQALANMAEVTPYGFGAKLFFVVGGSAEDAWVRKYDKANFVHVDASIVATQMMLEIEDLGLATTWVGSFDAPRLQEIYPQMKDYDLIAVFPVGYADSEAKPAHLHSDRKSLEQISEYL